jgi:hypothetical protein
MAEYEPATNWYRTRRHASNNLEPYGRHDPGRRGTARCSSSLEVFDQKYIDHEVATYAPHRRPETITDLPACKRCHPEERANP